MQKNPARPAVLPTLRRLVAPHDPRNPRTPDARRRGSVLLLAAVVVVLMAMMGAGFLQMARMDRTTSQLADTRSQDYEGSILRWIAMELLAKDGIKTDSAIGSDPNTLLYNQEPYDYPWTNPQTSVNRETNGDLLLTARIFGGIRTSEGGGINGFDDMWLASIEPDFTGTLPDGTPGPAGGYWPHISNPRGVFLNLGDIDLASGLPMQYTSTVDHVGGSSDFTADTNIPLSLMDPAVNPRADDVFADADGDGINDSRWTWAPLPVTLGRRYVMAVRIIDNSALADANTGNLIGNGVDYNTLANNVQPRWYSPGDLDLHATFLGNLPGPVAGAGARAIDGLLTDPQGRGYAGTAWNVNFYNWLRAGRMYGNPEGHTATEIARFATIGSELEKTNGTGETPTKPAAETFDRFERRNEAELRWRNGINRSSNNGTEDPPSQIELTTPTTGMARLNFWQQDAGVQTVYTDTPYSTVPGDFQPFFENEPRKRITLHSGSADYGRVNINALPGTAGQLADDVSDLLKARDKNFPNGVFIEYPPAVDPATAGGNPALGIWNSADDFADRVGAVIEDFLDDDSTLTENNGHYGMEYLPFISEVYVQARYDVTVIDNTPTGGSVDVTYRLANEGVESVIEFTNPWPWPIEIPANLRLQVGNENWEDLDTLLDDDAIGGNTLVLNGFESRQVRLDDTGDGGLNPTTTQPDVPNLAFADADRTDNDWPTETNQTGAEIIIELSAEATGGGTVPYQEFLAASPPNQVSVSYPDVPTANTNTGGAGTGDTAYIQYHTYATANGPAIMTVDEDDLQVQRYDNAGASVPPGDLPILETNVFASDAGQFGVANKTDPGNGFITSAEEADQLHLRLTLTDGIDANAAIPVGANREPFIIGNADVIYRAGDVFRMVFLGPSTGKTVAEVWEDAANSYQSVTGDPNKYRIDYFMVSADETFDALNGGDPYLADPDRTADTDNLSVTYGIRFLDKFSTLDPNEDNLDNDNDSRDDDPDENLVPGRINLNTASRDTLARVLPFGSYAVNYADTAGTDKRDLIDLIVQLRDYPGEETGAANAGTELTDRNPLPVTPGNRRRGLAYLGELMPNPTGQNVLGRPALDNIGDFNEYEQGWLTQISNPTPPDNEPSEPAGMGANFTVGPYGTGHFQDNFFGTTTGEERHVGLSALYQVANVRSDVFTAYIKVRAYPAGDFSGNPLEEYWIIATFDRSVMHDTRPVPRILSVAQFRP